MQSKGFFAGLALGVLVTGWILVALQRTDSYDIHQVEALRSELVSLRKMMKETSWLQQRSNIENVTGNKGDPTISDDRSSKIISIIEIANMSFCGPHPGAMVHHHYTLQWHDLLPHVAIGLRKIGFGNEKSGNIYMFGVAAGADSMPMVRRMFPDKRIFGFDSFSGLPQETHNESVVPQWRQGMFGPHDMLFPGKVVTNAISVAAAKLTEIAGGPELVTIVTGFFNESLSDPALVKKNRMGPAFYIDIDCDLFTSTLDALDFVFRRQLATLGTLVAMDDFWIIPCTKLWINKKLVSPLEVGEGGAFQKVAQRYGIVFRCVAGSCRMPPMGLQRCDIHNHIAPIFMVVAINGPGGQWDAGFDMSFAEQEVWMRTVPMCKNQAGK